MKNISQKRRYNVISLITFIIILLSFAYYYFIYVKDAESRFHQKAYRVLETVSKSIESKQKNYKTISTNALEHLFKYEYDSIKDSFELYIMNDSSFFELPKVNDLLYGKFRLSKELKFYFYKDIYENDLFYELIANKEKIYDIINLESYSCPNNYSILLVYNVENLFKHTLRDDVFKDYFAISNYSLDFKVDNTIYMEKVFSSMPINLINAITYKKYDSILFNKNLLLGTSLYEEGFNNSTDLIYITPIKLSDYQDFYLGGMISQSTYKKQTYGLSPIAITFLIISLILIILLFPLMKIWLLSENERLNTIDSVFGFFSIIIISSVLFLLSFHHFSRHEISIPNKKKTLCRFDSVIEKAFIEDVKSLIDSLQEIDTKLNPNIYNKENINFIYDSIFKDKAKGRFSWINTEGEQLVKWGKHITPRVNVSLRDYFKKAKKEKNLWNLTEVDSDFYIESILSITDGKHYFVASIKSNNDSIYEYTDSTASKLTKIDSLKLIPEVLMNSVDYMRSLKNTLTPENINFMLIDKLGKVIYHHDNKKILSENLLVETQNKSNLQAALKTNEPAYFSSKYENKDYFFHVNQIDKLPIFIVTYIDDTYEKTVSTQILGLSSTLYILFLLIIGIQIGIYILLSMKSKLIVEAQEPFFLLLWPDIRKNKVYAFLGAYNMLSIIVLISLSYIVNVFTIYFVIFLLFNQNLYILKFDNNNLLSKIKTKTIIYLLFTGTLLLGLLLINHSSVPDLICSIGFIVWAILATIKIMLVHKSKDGNRLNQSAKLFKSKLYLFYLLTVVILLGIAPLTGFFIQSFNFEKAIYSTNILHSFDNQYHKHNENNSDQNDSIIYTEHIKISNPKEYVNGNPGDEYEFFGKLRYPVNSNCNNSISYQLFISNNVYDIKNDNYIYYQHNDDDNVYKSQKNSFQFFNSDREHSNFYNLGLLILFFIMLVTLINYLVNYWVTRTFLLNLPRNKSADSYKLISTFKYVYIISPPYSGIENRLKQDCKHNNPVIIKLKNINDDSIISETRKAIRANNSKIVIILDTEAITTKLLGIKTLLISHLKEMVDYKIIEKIIIISNTQPSHKFKKLLNESETDNNEISICIDRYIKTIGIFKRIYYPVNKFDLNLNEEVPEGKLVMIKDTNSNFNESSESIEKNDILLEKQSVYQLYYYAIWNSFEEKEKLLLYDLAQDGLANYRNLETINVLVKKGILVYSELRLKIFDDSFSNFILSNIDRNESLQIELKAKQSGNWSNLRFPIMMVVFAIFIFLFITQQDKLNAMVGWVATSVASLPILMRVITGVSSLISGKST